MVVYWNGQDMKYYRETFVMDNETETITFGEPVLVKPRYLTEEEIESTFIEVEKEEIVDQGGQNGQEENTTEDGIFLSKSEAEQLEKDMAELQAFRKGEKELIVQSFKDLVSEEELNKVLAEVDNFSKEELEVKLSLIVARNIKLEKIQETKNFSAVKIFNETKNNPTNEDPTVTLINYWKDKK